MSGVRTPATGKLSKGRQTNGCYCAERHSTPRDIVLAFTRCKHSPHLQLQIDADGVATGYVPGTRGLRICTHCGAHQRTSDGQWVHGHLGGSAVMAGRRCKS